MADKANNGVEDLVQAYNEAVSSGVAAIDAGMAQTTAAAKVITDAMQSERTEYGKVWEQAADHARKRGESITALFPKVFEGTTAAEGKPGFPMFSAEAKESVNKIIEGEMAFYQAWTKTWMDYLAGMDSRRSAATQTLLEGNAKTLTSSQDAVKSAVKYGEAIIDWSLESVNASKS